MAEGLTYGQAKKRVVFGLFLLGGVTLAEVFFSLLGKGYVVPDLEEISWLFYLVGFVLVSLSLYKAYFIVYEFMHMGYEVRGLALSVLLPTLLLVWAIIAFFQEGNSWKSRRQQIEEKDKEPAEQVENMQGMLIGEDTYILEK
jgi:cytochrome c oxidase subunit 4